MKILILADELAASTVSAPALWLGELARCWMGRGHRLSAISTRACDPAAGKPPDDPAGIAVVRPAAGGFEAALGAGLEEQPDIVHVAGREPLGARVIETLREQPVLLDVHDFWPICPNSDLLRRPRLSACGEHFPFQGCGSCAGLHRLRGMDDRLELAACARLVVAHSNFARMRLSAGLGRPIDLIDYGVDTLRFRSEPEPPRASEIRALWETRERPRVLLLGPPSPARGSGLLTDLLVAMRARLPEVELVVAGHDSDDPDWDQIYGAEARELGLSRAAVVLRSVASEDLPALYASCQVAIAPGPGPDPGGLHLLQALATGLPVVARPGGAADEIVRNGESGLLVDFEDVGSFANAIVTLLLDPAVRLHFGENARLAVMERHDLARSAFALEELYRRVGSTRTRRAAA